MELFTFIMEFRGGTYIKQVSAPALEVAYRAWAAALEIGEIRHMGPYVKRRLIASVEEEREPPTPIATTQNVWIRTYQTKAGILILHIIKTAKN